MPPPLRPWARTPDSGLPSTQLPEAIREIRFLQEVTALSGSRPARCDSSEISGWRPLFSGEVMGTLDWVPGFSASLGL